MSAQDLTFLESYLLNPKEETISKLIKGSDQYYYFTLLKQFNDHGFKLPEDIKQLLSDYKLLKTEYARNIELRAKFLEFDELNSETPSPNNDEAKLKILRYINALLFGYQFKNQQPARVQAPSQTNNQLGQKKSTLTFTQTKYEYYIEKAYTEAGFKLITPQLYHLLEVKKITEAPLPIQKQFIHNLGNEIVDYENIPFLYNELFNNKKFNNEFNQSHFRKISLAQMEELLALNKKFLENEWFVGEYYIKKFQTNLKDVNYVQLEKEEIKNYKKKLRDLYDWTLQLPPKFKSFSDQVLFELLQVGNELNEYDFDLFLTYLKDPKSLYSQANDNQKNDYKKNIRQYQANWHDYHQFKTARWKDDDSIVRTYLHKYFTTTDNYDIFLSYLNEKYLQRELAYVKLLSGQEQQNIYNFFGHQELEQLDKQKNITICSYNKFTFKKGEPAKLYVEIKNIPSLNIKIFEIGTENYYLQKKTEIDQNIILDGLIASEEIDFQYNQPPIVKFTKEFTFETITKADRGIFIVEFIGNGVSSRAIIKKGRLLLKENITVAGHAFYILNEDFEVCTGPKTGLWVDNKFYVVDPVRQEILIPFGSTNKEYQAIIVHQNHSEITNIQIQQESYSLNCAFIVANEQLLLGAKAKTLIFPKLYINGNQASLKLLKDVLVTVTNVNDANVPSTLPFDGLKLQDGQPVEVQFPITAKIRIITIKFQAKITRMNQESKKEELLESNHYITFKTYESTNYFCQQYLRYTEDGYQIFLLGKNGEPKAGLDIYVQLMIANISTQYNETLTTDQDGKITLGHLENVNYITSSVIKVRDIVSREQSWPIAFRQQETQYPNNINVIVGERVEIPVSLQDKTYSLVKIFRDGRQAVLASVKHLVKEEQNQLIVVPDDEALYQLKFRANGQTIFINAIKAIQWKNDIVRQGQILIEDLGLKNKVILHSIEKQKQEDDKVLIKGKVTSKVDTQIIAVASQFDDQYGIQIIHHQILQLLEKLTLTTLSADLFTNIYQSDKELSDEQRYVLNRKNLERYVGNTLEKPQLLLKRQYMKDTENQSEQLAQGTGYSQSQVKPQSTTTSTARATGYKQAVKANPQNQQVSTFQDFLKNPALLINNIQIDGDQFQFELPDKFSVVYIIAFNNNNQTIIQQGLTNKIIEKRNLTHESALEKDKFYSIFRKTQLIKEGETLQIADITSTEMKLVDSLDKMFVFLKELRGLDGGDSEQSTGFNYWEFLIKWHKLTIDEKNKLYDEHQSNELNIFIYFRDPAYFETYTKAYINNKIEKDFIDKFLLDDKSYLVQQASIENLDRLNTLEQVLLVIYLAEIVDFKDQAKQIAQYLEQKSKLIQQDQKRYKALFDTVLGAKTGDESIQPESLAQDVNQPVLQQQAGGLGVGQQVGGLGLGQQAGGSFSNSVTSMMQQQALSRVMMRQAPPQQSSLLSMNQAPPPPPACSAFGAVTYQTKDLLDLQYDAPQNQDGFYDYGGGMEMLKSHDISRRAASFYGQARAQQQVEAFKNVENTKEYGERHYYKSKTIDEATNLVPLNKFWVDLAQHSITLGILKENFVSPNFIYCGLNHTQMIAVLALIGLPNEAPDNQFKQFQGKGVEIISRGTSILFTKEIKEGQAQLRNDILVAQRFFDPQDRFTYSDDDPELQLEKDVKECLVDKIYGCQVIITNCSSTRADYQVLVEVPNGAIPVITIAYTKSYTIRLEPYSTQRLEYFFYFPEEGNFSVYPANVSRFGNVICVAKEQHLQVVLVKTVADMEVLDDILVKGKKDDILNFVATKNIFNPNIFKVHEILYLLHDKDFYLKIIDIFRKRKYFNHTVWTYSLEHGDYQSLKELFNSQEVTNILKNKFAYFSCGLFEVSNIRLNEYYPLVTKRIHKLTQEAKGILNQEFRKQYLQFLTYLTQKPIHQISDKLAFIYYLLLQERINEAIQVYKTITEPPKEGEAVMQYDYFTAYLDFYIGFPNFIKAREICEKYLNYPVIHWRNLFYEIVNQLAEFDGDDDQKQQQIEDSQKQKIQKSAQKEEPLQINIEGQKIIITYSNLTSVTLQFYKVDLEILFSRNPFMNDKNDDYSFVLPNLSLEIPLESKLGLVLKHTIDVPEDLAQSNIFIQSKGVNKRSQGRYFSTSLNVQIMENNGQIKVSDNNGKYLSKIYVKTYIKEKNGKESFYKDGYTDLRGRFDYASLSSSELNNAEKFSILVMSDTLGSVIKEIQAPSQVGRFEQEVKLVSKAWATKAYETFDRQTENYSKNQMKHKKVYR